MRLFLKKSSPKHGVSNGVYETSTKGILGGGLLPGQAHTIALMWSVLFVLSSFCLGCY